MRIATKYFGEIDIEEIDIWHFTKGIPGFLNEKQFVLFPLEGQEFLFVMQSVQTKEIAFIVANPFAFFRDYDFSLEEQVVEYLNITTPENVLSLVILTIIDPFLTATANLQAPLILNRENKQAKQVILHNTSYSTKHALSLKETAEGC